MREMAGEANPVRHSSLLSRRQVLEAPCYDQEALWDVRPSWKLGREGKEAGS